jgi:hypothetical protein
VADATKDRCLCRTDNAQPDFPAGVAFRLWREPGSAAGADARVIFLQSGIKFVDLGISSYESLSF